MKYKKTKLKKNDFWSFWLACEKMGERVFWYDSQKDQMILAGGRFAVLRADESESKLAAYPYSFYSRHFFDSAAGPYTDFGGERLAFRHYFVAEGETAYLLSLEEDFKLDQRQPDLNARYDLTERPSDYAAWEQLFAKIQTSIASGETQKIVASRQVIYESNKEFELEAILQRLMDNNPKCCTFAYQKGEKIFLGASPEILIEKRGENILSYALAGTIAKNLHNAGQQLLNDSKNLAEHQIVVDKIRQKMAEVAEVEQGATGLMELKNIYHLHTLIKGRGAHLSLEDWVARLHPTPAMGGQPSQPAMDLLAQSESYERGLFAAPLGWIDSKGDGTLVVGIRSALIEGKKLSVYAGCGLVAQSDCRQEFEESRLKMRTIVEAVQGKKE